VSVLSLALLGTNALAYVVTVASARLLAPEAFGELAALLGVLLVGVVPAVGLQTATALALGGLRDRPSTVWLPVTRAAHAAVLLVGGATAVLAAALAAPVSALLHVTDPSALIWLAVLLVPHTVAGGYDGILQGRGRHGTLAAMLSAFGVLKLLGALAGLLTAGTPAAVLAGMAAGATAGAALGWFACGRPGVGPGADVIIRGAARAAGSLLGFVILSNLDLLLARHHLPAADAGRYAVGSIVFKVAFWLPQGVCLVVVPELGDTIRGRRIALGAVGWVATTGAVVVAGTALAAPLLPVVLGGAVPASVWLFALLGGATATAQVLLYSGIATRDRLALAAVWGAVGVECGVVAVLAGTGAANVQAVVSTAVAVVLLLVGLGLARVRTGGAAIPPP
jgi:hypothetical protein